MLEIIASSPGKLIVLGEYAVLGEAPALVSAVGARSKVVIRECEDKLLSLNAPDIGIRDLRFDIKGSKLVWHFDNPEKTHSKLKLVETILAYFIQSYPEGPLHDSNMGWEVHIATSEFYSQKMN